MAAAPVEDPNPVGAHRGGDRDLVADARTEQRPSQRSIHGDMTSVGVRLEWVDQHDPAAIAIVVLHLELVAQFDDVGVLGDGVHGNCASQRFSKPRDPFVQTLPLSEEFVLALGRLELSLEQAELGPSGGELRLETPATVGRQDNQVRGNARAWCTAHGESFHEIELMLHC